MPESFAIKDFKPRLYQETILASSVQKNTLIVLPTGLGKTNIFVLLAIQRLKQYPKSKILLLGPTRPLIDQYLQVFERHTNIPKEEMTVFTGMVKPDVRHEQWKKARIIFSTPQGLENDLIGNKISLKEVSLIGFDEAHRATGEYSYVWIAKRYDATAEFARVVGMTASPGSDLATIQEVCSNLFIEDVEARNELDVDVKPYVQEVTVKWIPVELSVEMKKIRDALLLKYNNDVERLRGWDVIDTKMKFMSRKDMIRLQGQLQARIAQGEKEPFIWQAISTVAEAMKVQHALELVETQGLHPLLKYLEKLESEARTTKVKAVKNLVLDSNFRQAIALARVYSEKGVMHPKMKRMAELVKEKVKNPDFKMIIFTQFRDSGVRIIENINKIGIKAKLFVGQTKKGDTGLSQKSQKEIIQRFKDGAFQVLVSTSVGEEGLDIPAVDMVIFYEPVPSAIRTVQRRGRTGRQSKGEVSVLFTKGTRDENYRWASHHREKRMGTILKSLKNTLAKTSKRDRSLSTFVDEQKPLIIVDHREKGSSTVKKLIELGADIQLKQLNVADYVLSNRVAVEFKTVEDFVASILDGRLLLQLQDLKKSYPRPIVIIEGTTDIYSVRNVHPNAIRGMMSTIMVSYGIPLLQTKDANETAGFLMIMARREQENGKRDFSLHPEKRSLGEKEQQEYIVSSLPGVGPKAVKPLLNKFKNVEGVMTASADELKEVELIGKKKAQAIRDILEKDY